MKCLVCGKHFDTTKIGRYKYCSEKCAKSKNNNNYIRDISTLRFNEPMQVDLEGDGYADGELVYDYGKCPKCGKTLPLILRGKCECPKCGGKLYALISILYD